ncbi:hypothetical protein ACHAWF_002760 [Thalassiosira exigua]
MTAGGGDDDSLLLALSALPLKKKPPSSSSSCGPSLSGGRSAAASSRRRSSRPGTGLGNRRKEPVPDVERLASNGNGGSSARDARRSWEWRFPFFAPWGRGRIDAAPFEPDSGSAPSPPADGCASYGPTIGRLKARLQQFYDYMNEPLDASELPTVASPRGRFLVALLCLAIWTAAKLSSERPSAIHDVGDDDSAPDDPEVQSFADRKNCQIIYVLGVEGAIHHGFSPVLENLARIQVDPDTDQPYVVTYADSTLRSALFGLKKESRSIDNPTLTRQVIRKICPRNGKKHVVLEDASFPSGNVEDAEPRTYRIFRQPWWLDSTMEEIAMSDTALNHPTNLYRFWESYSEYAELKFVALHRSYVETVASHFDTDGTARQHSNVVRGFMLLLRRFLDAHPVDPTTGRKSWTLVCVERVMARFHRGDEEATNYARKQILEYLADFLDWPRKDCPDCFGKWKDGPGKDYLGMLGEANVAIVLEQMRKLGGIWPPAVEDPLPEQKCSL